MATGVIQSVRLVGSPGRLLSAGHGKFLLAKVVVVVVMLKVADVNRQRVARRFRTDRRPQPRAVENLRRAMGTELAAGLIIVAVTAAMVVSPPAIADQMGASTTSPAPEPTTIVAQPDDTLLGSKTTSVALSAATAAVGIADVATSRLCVLSGESALQQGDASDDVTCLQRVLAAAERLSDEPTGTFDAPTLEAVTTFQRDRGLDVDGVVGRLTASELGIWPSE